MKMSSSLLLIQLNQNMQQVKEKSIIRPISYEALRQFITQNFKIISFVMYYFDQINKEVYITNNEDYKKSSDVIFIIEKKKLEESIYDKIYPNLSESKIDVIDEKYLCNLCSEKLTENPYYCYQCSKRFCKKCLTKLSQKNNPLKCPFCNYGLPFEKWLTLKNFVEERKQYLKLIEENIKLKEKNFIPNKNESEFLRQIKLLNTQLKEANQKIINQNILISKKDEVIKKLQEEINKLKKLWKNQFQEKNKIISKNKSEINIYQKYKTNYNNLGNNITKKISPEATKNMNEMRQLTEGNNTYRRNVQIDENKNKNILWNNDNICNLIFTLDNNNTRVTIQANSEELVSEAIAKYRKKSLDNKSNKFIFNGSELYPFLTISESNLLNGSIISVS